jgi:hypothetical protein
LRSLIFTFDPQEPQWQPHVEAGRYPTALLGWVLSSKEREEPELPRWVAKLLVRAWCRLAMVTYLRAADNSDVSAEQADQWIEKESGWRCRPPRRRSWWKSPIPDFELCATQSSDVAQELFYDDVFGWERRAQRVLLSAPGAPPPLGSPVIDALLQRPARIDDEALRAAGIWGLVFPGIDGDFAEIMAFSADDRQCLVTALRGETAAFGASMQVVSEQEFAATTWTNE